VVYLLTTLYQIFHRMKKKEIGHYLAKLWTKLCGLLFGPPCVLKKLINNVFYGIGVSCFTTSTYQHSDDSIITANSKPKTLKKLTVKIKNVKIN